LSGTRTASVLVLLLTLSYVLFYGQLWIVTWFVDLRSWRRIKRICPMIMTLKKSASGNLNR